MNFSHIYYSHENQCWINNKFNSAIKWTYGNGWIKLILTTNPKFVDEFDQVGCYTRIELIDINCLKNLMDTIHLHKIIEGVDYFFKNIFSDFINLKNMILTHTQKSCEKSGLNLPNFKAKKLKSSNFYNMFKVVDKT